jgi:hypothetical protein
MQTGQPHALGSGADIGQRDFVETRLDALGKVAEDRFGHAHHRAFPSVATVT